VEKDAQALADAVLNMVEQGDDLSKVGTFAQSYALEHFDMLHMVDQYEQLFTGS